MEKAASDDFLNSYQKLQQERLIDRKEEYLEVLKKTKAKGEILGFESIVEEASK
ncbi:hypothetical protein FJQ98_20835 [Lysinibacillus agricola]|uniref:Uncharacterized protein n=1 Tax=Lysinibacillus agricola TaxID=2590012 RepID=A0ABX7ANT5_9BACI|nr:MULTISPECIES: hypothetical protein [Lysinibacillus]QQP11611.1 hypothetical protein FJQ98_20835 [Lysinibacillus agricola]